MQTFWTSVGKKSRKTLLSFLGLVLLGCTSARENQLEQTTVVRPPDRPVPTTRDLNEQASGVNRKVNIEANRPNATATRPPEIRSQQIQPGRALPAGPDTTSTRRRPVQVLPDTTRRP